MSSDLQTFVDEIRQKPNPEEIEFELKLLLDKKYDNGRVIKIGYSIEEIKKMFKNLFTTLETTYKLEEHQYVNFISEDGTNKQFEFQNGIKINESRKIYSKTQIANYFMNWQGMSWKVKACREHATPNFIDIRTQYNLIRFKRRFSAMILPEWRFDYTFVIQLNNYSGESKIRDAKERLFLNEIHRMYDIAQCVEIELEYVQPVMSLTANSVNSVLAAVPQIIVKPTVEQYDVAMEQLKKMFSDKVPKNSNRRLSIKQLLPQTQVLTKKYYFNLIDDTDDGESANIGEFYASHKLDGERVLLFIRPEHSGYLTTTKWHPLTFDQTNYSAILDCELYNETLYAFDILEYEVAQFKHSMYMCPFLIRRKCLLSLTLPDNVKVKPFVKLGSIYSSIWDLLNNEQTEYPRDGFILTSVREPYQNTQYLKWKPPNKMTIEFIAKECPDTLLGVPPYSKRRNKTLYMLYVGIRSDMLRGFGLQRLQHYYSIFPTLKRKDYVPIHFTPSNSPLAYLYWSDRKDLDNKIVEMIWDNDSWSLVNVRHDRQADYDNNQYFGNDYYVAESIWNGYSNPFTYDNLKMTAKDMKSQFYFVKDNSKKHVAIRHFNNLVKNKLLESIGKNQYWLIDLGSGKGQDFYKYLKLNIRNTIFVDVNSNNIDEITSRKYKYFKQGHFRNTSMGIHTICADIADSKFVANVNQFMPHCKLIVCNFAIHYMCYNMGTMVSFAGKIAELLQADGRLLITYLNGKKIFEKIMNSHETDYSEWIVGKYHFQRFFIANTYTGTNQKISVKLPFSDGFYSEYLFNVDLLIKVLKRHKITVETRGDFTEYLNTYQHNMEMNNQFEQFGLLADDIEYVSLLEYCIFYKNNK